MSNFYLLGSWCGSTAVLFELSCEDLDFGCSLGDGG